MSSRGPEDGSRPLRRRSPSEDVEREIRSHVEMRADELVGEGWERAAANEEARRLFGDVDRIADECARIVRRGERVERRWETMGSFLQDLAYGARALRRAPGFTVVAVLTLGLGIGANTAVFSVVNGVLLRPLPYEEPEELVWAAERNSEGRPMSVAWPNFVDWEAESGSFEALTAYFTASSTILGGDVPVSARTAAVTRDFWRVFRVQPLRGRLTTPEEHLPGAQPSLVVSEAFWRSALAGVDPGGLVLEVGGVRAPVAGVVPEGFDFPPGTEVWGPLDPAQQSSSRTAHNNQVVGRLAEGVSPEQARQEVDALTRVIVEREADADPDYLASGAVLQPLQERLVGESERPLLMLLGAAGLVLLVACTNLASNLLARGSVRSRELAVRLALGAGRGRVARQLLTESVLLAGLGAIAGLVTAAGVVSALRAFAPAAVPRLADVGVDGWVLAYTGVLAVLTALLFGLLPVAHLSGTDPATELRSGTRGNAGEHRALVWGTLVATEVALALVLLIGSGLLVRSLQAVLQEDAGIDAGDALAARMSLSGIKYETPAEHAALYETLLRELEALPAVSAAGVFSNPPLGGSLPNGRMEIDGNLDAHADASYVLADAGAFAALDVDLLQGRFFDERDRVGSPYVAIVSRSFADRFWPGLDPIGRSVTGGGMDDLWQERPFAEVVGVVDEVRYRSLEQDPIPTVYFPWAQRPFRIAFGATVVVEAERGGFTAVAPGVRSVIQRIDPDVPLRVSPYEDLAGPSLAGRRFTILLLGGFSLIALVLAGVGIYGVVSYAVARRTREMGIRLALGARRGRVLSLVMLASLRSVAVGLVLGVIASAALERTISGLLYGVEPRDPFTLAAVVAILAGVAVLATWIPARAGTRVDPMVTMRAE